MPSVVRGDDNFDSAYGAALKAWVNFNGTGTVAIRAALNVSSITDNGTGDYTVNFATPMPDANYCVQGTSQYANDATNNSDGLCNIKRGFANPVLAGSVRIGTGSVNQSVADAPYCCVTIFR